MTRNEIFIYYCNLPTDLLWHFQREWGSDSGSLFVQFSSQYGGGFIIDEGEGGADVASWQEFPDRQADPRFCALKFHTVRRKYIPLIGWMTRIPLIHFLR